MNFVIYHPPISNSRVQIW